MLLGIHADSHPLYAAADLQDLGVDVVRHVARIDDLATTLQWITDLAAIGIKSLLVFTGESFPDRPVNGSWRYRDYLPYCKKWAEILTPYLESILSECGNEEDWASPSSWTMPQKEFNGLLKAMRVAFPATTLISGGFASGRGPEYSDGIVVYNFPLDDPCPWDPEQGAAKIDATQFDWRGEHPYGRRPTEDWHDSWGFGYVGQPLSYNYRVAKPGAITEFSIQADADSEDFQAEYLHDMMVALCNPKQNNQLVSWFCYLDFSDPGFGLLYADGMKKKSYEVYKQFISDYKAGNIIYPVDAPSSDDIEDGAMKIEDFEKKYPSIGPRWLGEPIYSVGGGVRIAGYANHILVELPGSGTNGPDVWPIKIDPQFS